jgi:hypothetical protein
MHCSKAVIGKSLFGLAQMIRVAPETIRQYDPPKGGIVDTVEQPETDPSPPDNGWYAPQISDHGGRSHNAELGKVNQSRDLHQQDERLHDAALLLLR